MKIIRQGQQADICLPLEGTFPYVKGKIQLLNQIIRGFQPRLPAVFGMKKTAVKSRYALPDNVVHLGGALFTFCCAKNRLFHHVGGTGAADC
ncbi:MAG: DUF3492 domain-containing protein [Acinetobacter sp.]